ncbi:hypothetical protein AB4865_08720 [Capnocytophaga sp. ARDL2]|uniref:hypothetical protein n=1 Tax=Capnocytophaga sp. ARDL2 TaxID=3238809 RepID=UPI0035580B4B
MKKIILTALLGCTSLVNAQSFEIQFKNTTEDVRMICIEGCDFDEVIIKASDFTSPRLFSNKGEVENGENAKYLFSIEKTDENTFKVSGIENTHWEELQFKLKGFWKNFIINHKGIYSL